MPEEFKPGCKRPEVKKNSTAVESDSVVMETKKEGTQAMIKVGKPAPEFSAPAFFEGKFVNVDLSEYRGKWVLVCFYPGDFTFV